jgi:transcription antitermination factor NusA-like protein
MILKTKSNLFIKMQNKKFDKQLFEKESIESDNEKNEIKDKYRRNQFLNKNL